MRTGSRIKVIKNLFNIARDSNVGRNGFSERRYTAIEYFLVLGVQFLSVLDLVFTIIHISEGGWELNPIMALALEGGYTIFGLIKMGITTLSLVVLVIHIRLSQVRFVLTILFFIYLGLFFYHLRFIIS